MDIQIDLTGYKETLDFLYNHLPMFQRQGAPAMKKNLDNIIALCSALDNPQDKFHSLHIAGTNGKGSTSHMLSALLQSQGFKVGVYTSPHYKDFRERIKINSDLISKKFVVEFVNKIRPLIAEIQPSFFEITVAMAFYYFSKQKVDYAIIEVGLGGRLDSTNIITPLISVITNISKDHTQFLGDTLVEIAGEKAGIIKVNIPLVIGEEQSEVMPVFEQKAKKVKAPYVLANDLAKVKYVADKAEVQVNVKQHNFKLIANWFTDYQVFNLQTAFATFIKWQELTDHNIDWKVIPQALTDLPELTYFLGRWMNLGEKPLIIAESAHNEAGLQQVFQKIRSIEYKTAHFVLGFSNDKDLATVLPFFPKEAKYYFAKADIPRGLDAKILQASAAEFGLKGRAYVSVKNAFRAAKRQAIEKDFIYVGGSIFIVAEVL